MIYRYLLVGAALITLPAMAADLKVEAGGLEGILDESIMSETVLRLSGTMDVRDFVTIADRMKSLRELDLTDVKIEFYRPAADKKVSIGEAEFAADALPAGALLGKKLTSLRLPAGLKTIGQGALAGNSFAAIEIPQTVTSIGIGAFYDNAALRSIAIPASVTELGEYALARCTALGEADLSSLSVTSLPDRLFSEDTALETVKFPAGIKTIGQGSFAGCTALESVSLPASVAVIGKHAFTGAGLKTVDLPKSVTEIGDYAFALCPALSAATLANGNAVLGKGLFFYCPAFVSFTASGISAYPDYLFAGDAALALPEGFENLKSIGAYALKDNSAEQLRLGGSLVFLGDGAMEGMTALNSVDAQALGDRIPELGSEVFAGIDQKSVIMTVAENTGDAWRAADQWCEFKISPVVGLDETLNSADTGVKAWFTPGILNVIAPAEIQSVEIYDTAGRAVMSLHPASESVQADVSALVDRIYVVRVNLRSGLTATFKLTR